jgi:hypothetical protein
MENPMHSRLAPVALAAALFLAGSASALTVPFTEEFATDNANWTNQGNAAVPWNATGGPDGSGYISTTNNYLGFVEPFPGAGPLVFRATGSNGASGGAFTGNWTTGGVIQVSAWVYQETGVDLSFYLRITTPANFPGAAFINSTPVPTNTWTEIFFEIADTTPPCSSESFPGQPSTCPASLANVGNFQFGTNAPAALTGLDQAFVLGLDKVTITNVPEPGTAMLLGGALVTLAGVGRRRG